MAAVLLGNYWGRLYFSIKTVPIFRPFSQGRAATSEPPATLSELERAHIQRVLTQMEGNVTRTASALGIDRRTLQRKLRSYGLSDE